MDKRFLGILAAIVIIFVGIFAVSKRSDNQTTNNSSSSKVQPTNHIEGKGTKNVTLVEYGDYQCPICEAYYLPVKQVVAQFSNDIYFQFRNLPLPPVHPNAFAAARAAEAAGLQNKYWEMHDKLYDNQSEWASSNKPQDLFNSYAQQLSLDLNKFKQDYASSQVNNAINADLAAFRKTGRPQATPTFFLDGAYLDNSKLIDPSTNAPSVEKFTQVLNAEIIKKNSSKSY